MQLTPGGQKVRHRCQPRTLSLPDMNKLISREEGQGRVNAITLETVNRLQLGGTTYVRGMQSPDGHAGGLSMDKDVAGLLDDDNFAPENVDAAADEAIEDESAASP